jgi:hypothetical protein
LGGVVSSDQVLKVSQAGWMLVGSCTNTMLSFSATLLQLSPYQQDVVGQAFKNAPKTALHIVQEVRGVHTPG